MPFSLRLLHSSPKEISKVVSPNHLKVRAYDLDFSTFHPFCNYNAQGYGVNNSKWKKHLKSSKNHGSQLLVLG